MSKPRCRIALPIGLITVAVMASMSVAPALHTIDANCLQPNQTYRVGTNTAGLRRSFFARRA